MQYKKKFVPPVVGFMQGVPETLLAGSDGGQQIITPGEGIINPSGETDSRHAKELPYVNLFGYGSF